MNTIPPKHCVLAKHSTFSVTVTRKMVRERAVELAVIIGRSPQDVTKADWDQAKRELMAKPDSDLADAVQESTAESERWDPVSGSTGHKVHVPSGDDEDDEGRSDPERLVERGVRDAGRDQMREAAREADQNG
jgi:hypothetical protein